MTTIIPKDCLLCDVCNAELVSESGEVLEPCMWTDWGLICWRHTSKRRPIQVFEKGETVPRSHVLWLPLVIE